ncbi:hypothetical protein JHK87_039643 [Glycine soja]|nr:hypothetical protein JHK87_039643 [Glycine soja]
MHKDEFKGGKVLLQLSGKCERNKVDEGSRLAGPGEGVEKDEFQLSLSSLRQNLATSIAGKFQLSLSLLRWNLATVVAGKESTIGVAFFSQVLAVNDATVKFEIWDTSGQERFALFRNSTDQNQKMITSVYEMVSKDA